MGQDYHQAFMSNRLKKKKVHKFSNQLTKILLWKQRKTNRIKFLSDCSFLRKISTSSSFFIFLAWHANTEWVPATMRFPAFVFSVARAMATELRGGGEQPCLERWRRESSLLGCMVIANIPLSCNRARNSSHLNGIWYGFSNMPDNSVAQFGTQYISAYLHKLVVTMLLTKAKSTYEVFFRKELSF